MSEELDELAKGWRILLGCVVGVSCTFASLYFYTAGIFLKPLAETFGWTRGEASLGALAVLVGGAVSLPLAGRIVDRFGERRVAFLSTIGVAICFVLLAKLTAGLGSYLVIVTLLAAVSSGANLIPYSRLLTRHFHKLRGLAYGIALAGTVLGAAILPPILAPFVDEHGWRAGYMLIAGLALPSACVMALLVGRQPERDKEGPGHRTLAWGELLRHPAFQSIGLLVFLAAAAVLGTTYHIVALLTDHGMSVAKAGAFASSLGLAVVVGRVGAGYLLDRWNPGTVTTILLCIVSCGLLALASGVSDLLLPGTILVGLGVGIEGDIVAYLIGRRFDIRHFGSVYGSTLSIHAIGANLGGVAAGVVFDLSGQTYQLWLCLSAGFLAVAALIAWRTERHVANVNDGDSRMANRPEPAEA